MIKKNHERKQNQRVEISKGADTLLNNRRKILDLNKVSLKMETGLLFRQIRFTHRNTEANFFF